MSAPHDAGYQDVSSHSLVFRVMRLCRPALQADLLVRTMLEDLWLPEDAAEEASANPTLVQGLQAQIQAPAKALLTKGGEEYFRARTELERPLDALGLNGLMVLPQSFGSIHLGETFCSYISVGNHANHDVSSVVVKAELQTERQRVVLSDNSASPLARIQSGGRYDFIIEHDIKELGAHTLVCSASYIDFGESKYLPQYFKFVASNPLSVKTKDSMYLEASIENCGKAGLFLDRVHFEPVPPWRAAELRAPEGDPLEASEEADWESEEEPGQGEARGERGAEARGTRGANDGEESGFGDGAGKSGSSELEEAVAGLGSLSIFERRRKLVALREGYRNVFAKTQVLVPNGGTEHFLYCLNKDAGPRTEGSQKEGRPNGAKPAQQQVQEGGGTLGRLEIAWRSANGEPGRLQTQQILGNPVPRKEVEVRLLSLPEKVFVEHPFLIVCQLVNHTDRVVGPLKIVIAKDEPGSGNARAIVVSGPWSLTVAPLEAQGTYDFQLCLVALAQGVQRLSGVGVVDERDGKPYDALPPTDMLVECP